MRAYHPALEAGRKFDTYPLRDTISQNGHHSRTSRYPRSPARRSQAAIVEAATRRKKIFRFFVGQRDGDGSLRPSDCLDEHLTVLPFLHRVGGSAFGPLQDSFFKEFGLNPSNRTRLAMHGRIPSLDPHHPWPDRDSRIEIPGIRPDVMLRISMAGVTFKGPR